MIYMFRMSLLVLLLAPLFPMQAATVNSDSSVLVYGDSVEVDVEFNAFETIAAGAPIQGSVTVTHAAKNVVHVNSFKIGDKPLKVQLSQTVQRTAPGNIEVSIYNFQLEGMSAGLHTLPPITVKVADTVYATLPSTIMIYGVAKPTE